MNDAAPSALPTAPGPKGHPLFGMLPDFRGDRLSFLVRMAREYGGVVRFTIRNRAVSDRRRKVARSNQVSDIQASA